MEYENGPKPNNTCNAAILCIIACGFKCFRCVTKVTYITPKFNIYFFFAVHIFSVRLSYTCMLCQVSILNELQKSIWPRRDIYFGTTLTIVNDDRCPKANAKRWFFEFFANFKRFRVLPFGFLMHYKIWKKIMERNVSKVPSENFSISIFCAINYFIIFFCPKPAL